MYKIEKGIPVIRAKRKDAKYPFHQMEVGDSFFIPCLDKEKNITQRLIYSAAYRHSEENNKEFKVTTRQIEKGVRVWRKS